MWLPWSNKIPICWFKSEFMSHNSMLNASMLIKQSSFLSKTAQNFIYNLCETRNFKYSLWEVNFKIFKYSQLFKQDSEQRNMEVSIFSKCNTNQCLKVLFIFSIQMAIRTRLVSKSHSMFGFAICICCAQLRFERHLSVHKLFLNMWGAQNQSRQRQKLPSAQFFANQISCYCLVQFCAPHACFCKYSWESLKS